MLLRNGISGRPFFSTATHCKHGILLIPFPLAHCKHLRLMLSLSPAAVISLSLSLPGLVKSVAFLLVILNVRSLPLFWHCTWLLLINVRFLLSRLLIIITSEGFLAPQQVVVALATCAHTRALLVSHGQKRLAQELRRPCAHWRESA